MQQRGKGVIVNGQEERKLFRVARYCSQREVLDFRVGDVAVGTNFLMTLSRMKSFNVFCVWSGKAWTSDFL